MADEDKERKILELARKRFKLALDADDNREHALDDIKFSTGEQWPDDIRRSRENDPNGARPCLTIDKTHQYVRQVVNDARQNKPQIKVHPVDSEADPDTAEVFNGIIRHIEVSTDADVCYDTALECAARGGFGFFGLMTDYIDSMSFDQEAKFRRIRNPFSVYLDPNCQTPEGSDAEYGFISGWIDRDEADAKGWGIDWDDLGRGDDPGTWLKDGRVRIVEYYAVEKTERVLCQYADGTVKYKDEEDPFYAGVEKVRERKVQDRKVVWRKMAGNKVLAQTDFPSRWIPIFRVVGEEVDIEGKLHLSGVIRRMKDSQRMYNYWLTDATERVALSPKAPFVGAEGQFEGHENEWRAAARRSMPYLEYKPVTLDGINFAPPPQRQVHDGPPNGTIQMAMIASDEMKSTSGIYDAGLGAQGNEQSGLAITARQRESDNANFHYVDNLGRAIRHAGRVLVDLIPKIYDTERVIRILGEDESEEMVRINAQPEMPEKDENGIRNIYRLDAGRYDVTVTVGPGYATKRMEAADYIVQLTQSVGGLDPIAAKALTMLAVKNMDWPGAEEAMEIIKKTLPPELVGEDEEEIPAAMVDQIVNQQVQQAVEGVLQQVEQSREQQEVRIKEYEAETKRLNVQLDAMTNGANIQEQVRDIVAEAFAEMIGAQANG